MYGTDIPKAAAQPPPCQPRFLHATCTLGPNSIVTILFVEVVQAGAGFGLKLQHQGPYCRVLLSAANLFTAADASAAAAFASAAAFLNEKD